MAEIAIETERGLSNADRPWAHLGRRQAQWSWGQGLARVVGRWVAIGLAVAGALLTWVTGHYVAVPALTLALLVLDWRVSRWCFEAWRTDVEPTKRRLLAYRRRSHSYVDGGEGRWRLARRTKTVRLGPPHRGLVALPVPTWHAYKSHGRLAEVWGGSGGDVPAVAPSGSARLRDGRYIAALHVTPIVATALAEHNQEMLYARFGQFLAQRVGDGRCIQLIRDTRGVDLRAVQKARRDRQTADHPVLVEARMVAEKDEEVWYRDAFSAQTADYVVVDGETEREVARRVAVTTAALKGLGLGVRPLDGAETGRMMAEAERGEPPKGAPRLGVTSVVETETYLDTETGYRRSFYAFGDWEPLLFPVDVARLGLLPCRSRLSVTIRGMDRRKAEDYLRAQEGYLVSSNEALDEARSGGVSSSGDGAGAVIRVDVRGAGHAVGDATINASLDGVRAAQRRVARGKETLVEVGIVLTVYADTLGEMESVSALARDAFKEARLQVGEGAYDQIELWRRSLPLALPPRSPLLATTATAGGLMVFHKESPGHERPVHLLGRTEVGGQLVFFDWERTATKSFLAVGQQGFGKSVLMGQIIWDLLEEGDWTLVVDPTGSYEPTAEATDGAVLRLLSPGVDLNILELTAAMVDDEERQILALMDIFELILTGGARSLDPWEASALDAALGDMVRAGRPRDGYLRASHVVESLQAQQRAHTGERRESDYETLWMALLPYVDTDERRGTFASLLDRPTRIRALGRDGGWRDVPDALTAGLVVVNNHDLLKTTGVAGPLGMYAGRALANWRAKHAALDGHGAALFFEEAWSAVKLLLPWIAGTSRTIRHGDLKVGMSTQNPSDIAKDRDAANILTAVNVIFAARVRDHQPGERPTAEVLADVLGLPLEAARRIEGLTREIDVSSEIVFVTRSAEVSETQWGVFQDLVPRERLYCLRTYGHQKRAREADIARYGSVWEAAKAWGKARRQVERAERREGAA